MDSLIADDVYEDAEVWTSLVENQTNKALLIASMRHDRQTDQQPSKNDNLQNLIQDLNLNQEDEMADEHMWCYTKDMFIIDSEAAVVPCNVVNDGLPTSQLITSDGIISFGTSYTVENQDIDDVIKSATIEHIQDIQQLNEIAKHQIEEVMTSEEPSSKTTMVTIEKSPNNTTNDNDDAKTSRLKKLEDTILFVSKDISPLVYNPSERKSSKKRYYKKVSKDVDRPKIDEDVKRRSETIHLTSNLDRKIPIAKKCIKIEKLKKIQERKSASLTTNSEFIPDDNSDSDDESDKKKSTIVRPRTIKPATKESDSSSSDGSDSSSSSSSSEEDNDGNITDNEEVVERSSSCISFEHESVIHENVLLQARDHLFRESDHPIINAVTLLRPVLSNIKPRECKPKKPCVVKNYAHRCYPIRKAGLVTFPKIKFSDYGGVPANEDTIIYPTNLELVPLSDLNCLKNIKIIPSRLGSALKRISRDAPITNSIYRRSIINNETIDLSTYYYIYGVIPKRYVPFIEYLSVIILSQIKDLKLKKNSSIDKNNIAHFIDGGIETLVMGYWQLSTQDLINWKDDIPRKTLKRVLERACFLLYHINKQLAATITHAADFTKNDFITANCLLYIKNHYAVIMDSIVSIKHTDYDTYCELRCTWDAFMFNCNIHHFRCPHTLTEIYKSKNIQMFENRMIFKMNELFCDDDGYNKSMCFSSNDTYKIFAFFPGVKLTGISNLQYETSKFFLHFCQLFARHVVEYKLCDFSKFVSSDQVAAFCNRYKHLMCSTNDALSSIPNCDKKMTNKMCRVVSAEIAERYNNKIIKMDDKSLELLYNFITSVMWRAIAPLLYSSDLQLLLMRQTSNELLAECIFKFFKQDDFVGLNADMWSQFNDKYDNNWDEEFEIEESQESSDDSEYNSSDDDLYLDEKELTYLKRYEERNQELKSNFKFSSSATPSTNVSAARLRKEYKTLLLASTYYKLSPTNISRIKCIMCYKKMTGKATQIASDILVPCCLECMITLIKDKESENPQIKHDSIISRIRNHAKPPIAFDTDGKFLESIEYSPVRYSYNKMDKKRKMVNKKEKKIKKSDGTEKKTKQSPPASSTESSDSTNKTSGQSKPSISQGYRIPKRKKSIQSTDDGVTKKQKMSKIIDVTSKISKKIKM